jgi:hypothetical protein
MENNITIEIKTNRNLSKQEILELLKKNKNTQSDPPVPLGRGEIPMEELLREKLKDIFEIEFTKTEVTILKKISDNIINIESNKKIPLTIETVLGYYKLIDGFINSNGGNDSVKKLRDKLKVI